MEMHVYVCKPVYMCNGLSKKLIHNGKLLFKTMDICQMWLLHHRKTHKNMIGIEELKNNWIYFWVPMVNYGLKEKPNQNTPDVL